MNCFHRHYDNVSFFEILTENLVTFAYIFLIQVFCEFVLRYIDLESCSICFFFLVPARSPYIWYYHVIDYSTVFIKWQRLPQRDVRGILRGYRIYLSIAYNYYYPHYLRNITVGPEIQEMRISGLRSSTTYRIWVKPFTAKGEAGPKYEMWITTSKSSVMTQERYEHHIAVF